MELRDVAILAGWVFGLVGIYVALDRRVTRMEAIEHRVEQVEDAVVTLTARATETGEDLAGMRVELTNLAKSVGSLESTLQQGVTQVLKQLRDMQDTKGSA